VRMPGKVPEKHVQVIFDVFSQNNSYRSSLFLFLMGVFCLFQLSSMNFELGLRSKRILVISFAQIPRVAVKLWTNGNSNPVQFCRKSGNSGPEPIMAVVERLAEGKVLRIFHLGFDVEHQ